MGAFRLSLAGSSVWLDKVWLVAVEGRVGAPEQVKLALRDGVKLEPLLNAVIGSRLLNLEPLLCAVVTIVVFDIERIELGLVLVDQSAVIAIGAVQKGKDVLVVRVDCIDFHSRLH